VNGPSHRDPTTPQIEFCDLCGAPVGAADRIRATAQGLVGAWVCKDHAELATNPSFLDLGGDASAPIVEPETEPHSGHDIWAETRQ
jgi:hypothetical protein